MRVFRTRTRSSAGIALVWIWGLAFAAGATLPSVQESGDAATAVAAGDTAETAVGAEQTPATTAVRGRIADGEDRPVAALTVQLVATDYRGKSVITTTDDGGRYSFTDVVPGNYRVRIESSKVVPLAVEVAARAGDAPAWDRAGVIDPADIPVIPIEAGQSVRYDMVVVDPAQRQQAADSFRTRLEVLMGLVQQGRCPDALPGLEDYLAGFPGNATAAYLVGYCQATLGRSAEAARALQRALELQPGMPGVALLLGQVQLQSGAVDEAAVALRQEIDAGGNPRMQVEAWLALGFLERDRGRHAEAIAAFEQVVAAAPERKEPYAELAELYRKTGQPDKAVQILIDAGRPGAAAFRSLLNIGIDEYNAKDHERAAGTFRQAMKLATDDRERAMAWALLGFCQIESDATADGIASLKRSLELDADGKYAPKARERIGQLGG